jgi:dUTPase
MGCQPISSDFRGPLLKDTVGLLLGRSSSSLKGLVIYPGVIDSDYEGQVKIMCSAPRGIMTISPGDRIAQLLILPSLYNMFPRGQDS